MDDQLLKHMILKKAYLASSVRLALEVPPKHNQKKADGDFPGGAVVKNLPASCIAQGDQLGAL